jgi:SAM-dependent methyltransferase
LSNQEDGRPVAIEAYESMADAYAAEIETNPRVIYYERPAMRGLLPNVSGLRVLDAGCGSGVLMEVLLAQGADVVGVDVSTNMVRIARERVGSKASVHQSDLGRPMPFLESSSFDVIVSSGTLGYIRDWTALFREFSRLLRDAGCAVFSVGHPCSEYTLDKTDDYFATELREYIWRALGASMVVPCYRRPFAEMVNPVIDAGFSIDRIIEPVPMKEFGEVRAEEYAWLLRRPRLLCMRARKCGNGT